MVCPIFRFPLAVVYKGYKGVPFALLARPFLILCPKVSAFNHISVTLPIYLISIQVEVVLTVLYQDG